MGWRRRIRSLWLSALIAASQPALQLAHDGDSVLGIPPRASCSWTQTKNSCLPIWAKGYDRLRPPYNATSLAAAQAWCCDQGSACAGITFHGGGPQPTNQFDAMAGEGSGEWRCHPVPVKYKRTTSWSRHPCPILPPPPPRPPAPPRPGPPGPVVPPGTPRVVFDAPVLVGPAVATCESCGPGPNKWIRRSRTAPPAVCGTVGYGFDANASTVFPDCGACCDNYHALDEVHWFGFSARTVDIGGAFHDGQGLYPDRLAVYFSSDSGRSWVLSGSVEAWQVSTLTGPGVLIPGPAPFQLHSTGVLERVVDDQTGLHVLRGPNSTVFSIGTSGNLQIRTTGRYVTYRGLNFSAKCAPPHGHVGTFGLRLVGAGITKLGDGTLFHTAISCLGGDAQTAKQHAAGGTAASLVGFISSDGYNFTYRAPVYTAAAFPRSIIGPTEHDVTVAPGGPAHPERLLVVVRADGNGLPCWSADYYQYTQVMSTDKGWSWSTPVPVNGAGCVRPRLITVGQATLLSGGRLCVENVSDNFLWISGNREIESNAWRRYSLSGVHNALWNGERSLRFSGGVNSSDASGKTLGTLSYTSLLPGPNASATIVYGMYANYRGVQGANVAFSMRMHVSTTIPSKTDDESEGAMCPSAGVNWAVYPSHCMSTAHASLQA